MSFFSTAGVIAGYAVKGAGSALWGAGKFIGKSAYNAGKYGASKAAPYVKKAAGAAASGVKDGAIWTAKSVTKSNPLDNPLGQAARTVKNGASKMGYWDYGKRVYDAETGNVKEISSRGLKFTNTGKATLAGIGIVAGGVGTAQSIRDQHVGQIDATPVTATPVIEKEDYSSGVDNGGATGDLVFALHNNRFG